MEAARGRRDALEAEAPRSARNAPPRYRRRNSAHVGSKLHSSGKWQVVHLLLVSRWTLKQQALGPAYFVSKVVGEKERETGKR